MLRVALKDNISGNMDIGDIDEKTWYWENGDRWLGNQGDWSNVGRWWHNGTVIRRYSEATMKGAAAWGLSVASKVTWKRWDERNERWYIGNAIQSQCFQYTEHMVWQHDNGDGSGTWFYSSRRHNVSRSTTEQCFIICDITTHHEWRWADFLEIIEEFCVKPGDSTSFWCRQRHGVSGL